MMDH
jgi:dynein heavy chain 1